MILVDFSPVVISAVTGCFYSTKSPITPDELNEGFIRNMVLNMLRSYKARFGNEYGELVICIDSKNTWRKEFFPEYKAHRKKDKEQSAIDWDFVYRAMDTLMDELREYFPYPIVKVPRTEADDIIGVLTEWAYANDIAKSFIDIPKPLLIISGDGDFIQLQKFKNVKQYRPVQKDFAVLPEGFTAKDYLIEHIIEGDSKSDGVPNVLSGNRCLVDKIRQTPLVAARRAEFMEHGKDACRDDFERANWDRNQKLVDLSMVPEEYKSEIIATFEAELNRSSVTGRRHIRSYLFKKGCVGLLEYLNDF